MACKAIIVQFIRVYINMFVLDFFCFTLCNSVCSLCIVTHFSIHNYGIDLPC